MFVLAYNNNYITFTAIIIARVSQNCRSFMNAKSTYCVTVVLFYKVQLHSRKYQHFPKCFLQELQDPKLRTISVGPTSEVQ
jgi:hypothetical protein